MDIEKDPAQDRDEFEARIKSSLCGIKAFPQENIMQALVSNDSDYLTRVNQAVSHCESKVAQYLSDWDNAEDEEARRVVVGSVKGFSLSDLDE